MKIPKIYLETTIFNFPFVDDAPQYRADTLKLFDEIKAGKFKPYTSEYVIQELEDTKEAGKLEKMKALITDYGIETIPANPEAIRLADVYGKENIIPAKYKTDAIHIASATIEGLDFIVSLNFKHIVKRKTKTETGEINIREGYMPIGIYSPMEVVEYEEDT